MAQARIGQKGSNTLAGKGGNSHQIEAMINVDTAFISVIIVKIADLSTVVEHRASLSSLSKSSTETSQKATLPLLFANQSDDGLIFLASKLT